MLEFRIKVSSIKLYIKLRPHSRGGYNNFSKNFRKYCIFNKKCSIHVILLLISNKKNVTGKTNSLALLAEPYHDITEENVAIGES